MHMRILLPAVLGLLFGLALAAQPLRACEDSPCLNPEAPALPDVDQDRF
jgi:hypothetical protein